MQSITNTSTTDTSNIAVLGNTKTTSNSSLVDDFSNLLKSSYSLFNLSNNTSVSFDKSRVANQLSNNTNSKYQVATSNNKLTQNKTSKNQLSSIDDNESYQNYKKDLDNKSQNTKSLNQQNDNDKIDDRESCTNENSYKNLQDNVNQRVDAIANNIKSALESNGVDVTDDNLSSIKSSLQNLSNENLDTLENSDLDSFVKNVISSNKSLSSLMDESNDKSSIDDLMSDLLDSLNVEDISLSQSSEDISDDLSLDDLDLINQSLKIKENLNENIESEELKLSDKINPEMLKDENQAFVDNDKENSAFKNSLDILKAHSSNEESIDTISVNQELSDNAFENLNDNNRMSLEDAIKLDAKVDANVIKGASASSNDNSSFGGSDSKGQNLFANQLSQTTKIFREDIVKQEKLLNLSSNMKANAQALAQKVMEMSSKNLKTLDLTLNPEGLGKMRISIDATDSDDVTKITISASNEATKNLVSQSLDDLKNNLHKNDIDAEALLQDYEDESQNQEFAQNQNEQNNEANDESDSLGTLFAQNDNEIESSENQHSDIKENLYNSQNERAVNFFA